MAEIIQVSTVVRRLLSPDSYPWQTIVLPTNLQRLKERYKFSELVQVPSQGDNSQIIASGGEFDNSGLLCSIQQLSIEPSVIQVHTNTDDLGAHSFYTDLMTWFSEIKGSQVAPSERAKTFQTIIIAKLEADMDQVFSRKLSTYITDTVTEAVSLPDVSAEIAIQSLSWKVSYRPKSGELLYLPKVFTVEPRVGSNLRDRIYYTVSPTDYATHVKLLIEFEKSFAPALNPRIKESKER
jgi:hypothetical protein